MILSHQQKQFWMSNAIIVTSLFGAAFFPTDNVIQSFIVSTAFLVGLPLIFTRVFLNEKPAFLGFSFGNVMQGSIWLTVFLLLNTFLLIGMIRYTDILSRFTLPLTIRLSFPLFLVFVIIVGLYMFMAEFFFRGFVFSVWRKVIGTKALFIQAFAYLIFLATLIHWKISTSFIIIGILALISGFLVVRSRSILYSFLFSYISVILGIASVIFFVK